MHALPYFIATFEGYAVTIKRDADYNTTLEYLQQSIPKLRSADTQNIHISTTLAEYGSTLVQISEATWPDLVDHVKTAEITLGHAMEAEYAFLGPLAGNAKGMDSNMPGENILTTVAIFVPAIRGAPPYNKLWRPASNPIGNLPGSAATRFSLIIRTTFRTFRVDNIHPSSSIKSLKSHIEKQHGLPVTFQKFHLLGKPLDDGVILNQFGITAEATLDLALSTRKSRIYCVAPRHDTLEKFPLGGVKVALAVDRGWELVALAPSEDLEYKGALQSAYWVIDIASDGTLWDRMFREELDCLSWDGIREGGPLQIFSTRQQQKLSPSIMRTKSPATVEPKNSMVVPLFQAESYISSALCAMGFESSSKFLSQFMAQLESKSWTHLALRFLSEAESEALSSLEVDPSPQSVVHIMMLYKGLSDLDDLTWGTSLLTLVGGSDTRGGAVGAEPAELADRNVFSVYEITWMEVF